MTLHISTLIWQKGSTSRTEMVTNIHLQSFCIRSKSLKIKFSPRSQSFKQIVSIHAFAEKTSCIGVRVFTGSGVITGSDRIGPDRARNWPIPFPQKNILNGVSYQLTPVVFYIKWHAQVYPLFSIKKPIFLKLKQAIFGTDVISLILKILYNIR